MKGCTLTASASGSIFRVEISGESGYPCLMLVLIKGVCLLFIQRRCSVIFCPLNEINKSGRDVPSWDINWEKTDGQNVHKDFDICIEQ